MPSITDTNSAPAKILLIGKSGAGKTGSLASLVAAGYNLRILDTDKGIRPLRSLILDPRYPYHKIIQEKNINLTYAVRYVEISTEMRMRSMQKKIGENKFTTETILAPKDANAWPRAMNLLDKWKEDDIDLGPVSSWDVNDVLVLDSFSTLARCAYYFAQSLNSRLGARDIGYDYQRDVGEAQAQLTRLLELLYDSNIKCNVIVISHITWVDESQGVASRPKSSDGENKGMVFSNPDGYPSAIGRALSPQMGKYFNDVYIVQSAGSGSSVTRTISTVPQEGVIAKHSTFLEREYPIQNGLAKIFSALHERPFDPNLENISTRQRIALPSGENPNQSTLQPRARAQT